MHLDKLKELEDLRNEKNDLSEKYHHLVVDKKTELLQQAVQEFKLFFQKNDFSISEQPKSISASYKQLNIVLSLPSPEDNPIGAFVLMELTVKGTINKNYRVPINDCGKYPKWVVEQIITKQKNMDQTQKEIINTHNEIDKVTELLRKFNKRKFCYGIFDKEEAKTNKTILSNYPQYESFNKLLEDIFTKLQ